MVGEKVVRAGEWVFGDGITQKEDEQVMIREIAERSWRDSIANRVLTLHVADLGSIISILYSSLSTSRNES